MPILKLAAVTCLLYFGVTLVMQTAFWAASTWFSQGAVLVSARPVGWVIVFGIIWLASFSLAWRVVVAPVLSKIPH